MEQQGNGKTLGTGIAGSSAQVPYRVIPYPANQMTGLSSPASAVSTQSSQTADGFSASSAQMVQHQLTYQHMHQQPQQQQRLELQQKLQNFWASQYEDIDQVADFKNRGLPLARIKKIMKADEDVRMISADTPVILAQACDMFIQELTLRAWHHTEENKRRTLQKTDVAVAVAGTDLFDFLVDILPREGSKDEVLTSVPRGPLPAGAPTEGLPCYYMPQLRAPPIAKPDDPALYGQHPGPYTPSTDGGIEALQFR